MKNLIFILLTIFLGCSKKNNTLPQSFVEKNKNKDLSLLFNVTVEARNERDGVYHYSYFHTLKNNDTLLIPSIEFFDELIKRDTTFNKSIYKLAKTEGINPQKRVEFAKEYSQKIDILYKDLGVVSSTSNLNLGKFIEFSLNEKCKVYYLDDAKTLTPYFINVFHKLEKLDDKWYFECN